MHALNYPTLNTPLIMETFRRILRIRHFFLSAVFCFGTGLSAQVTAPVADDDEVVLLDKFEVSSHSEVGYYSGNSMAATRLDTPIDEIAQSIYVINKELIRDIAAADLAEMVVYTPEMAMGETGDDRVGISMRGNNVGDPLVNGVALQSRGTIFSMANIERAEIVAGPTSIFLANESGIGGGINLSTKRPGFRRPAGSAEVQIKSGDILRLVADYGAPFSPRGNWAWRLVFEGVESREEDGFVEDFAEKTRVGLMPSLGWRSGSRRTSFFLLGEVFYQETNRPKGADLIRNNHIVQVPADVNVNSGYDTMERNQASLQALFTHALSGNWAVRAVAMATYNDNLKNTMGLNGNSDWGYDNLASGGLIGWARTYIEEYREIRENYAFQVDLAGMFNTGPITHQLIVGSDLKYNSSKQEYAHALFPADQQLFDVYHPDYDITPGPKFPHRNVHARGSRVNFYVNENMKMLRERIVINLGLRGSDFSQSSDRIWYYPNPRPPHIEYPSKWTMQPRAGLVVKIVRPVSLYYGYTETYIPRTDFFNPDGSFLDPETGVQHEAGVKALLFKQRVILNTSVYDLRRENIAERDDARSSEGLDYYTSDRSIRVRGWNLKLTVNPLRGLQFNGSLSTMDVEITGINNLNLDPVNGNSWQLGKTPKFNARMRGNWNVTYEFHKGMLRGVKLGVFGIHVGERPADIVREGKPFAIPAYDRYDAFVRYSRKGWSIQLNVNNLFDKRYYPYIDYYRDGGNGTARRAPPREFTVTFRREM
jgi:iron complex outermembrane receptor protein